MNVVVVLLLLVIAAGVGRRLLDLLHLPATNMAEEGLLSLALGFGLISLVTFLLGIAHGLYPMLILAMMAAFAVVGFRGLVVLWRRSQSASAPRISWITGVTLCIVVGHVIANLVVALTPPAQWDALVYHLAAPQTFLREHYLIEMPDVEQTYWPIAIEMLYMVLLPFGGDTAPQLLHLAFGILATGSVALMCQRLFPGVPPGLAAAIFIAQPVVNKLVGTAKIDMGYALYAILGLHAAVVWHSTRNWRWLCAAAIMCGLAAATKLIGVFLVLLLLPVLFVNQRESSTSARWSALRAAAVVAGVITVIISPWLIRSALLTGDPVYPYLSRFLQALPVETARTHVISITGLVRIPWTLTMDVLPSSAAGAPLFLALLPGLLLIRGRDRIVKPLLVGVSLYIGVFYFFSLLEMRFLLPALGVFSILAAYVAIQLTSTTWRALRIALFVVVFTPLAASLYVAARRVPVYWDVVVGKESRDAFLTRRVGPLHDVLRFANQTLPTTATIFAGWEVRRYYSDRRFLSGNSIWWINESAGIATPQELRNKLRALGVTHVLLSWDYHNTLRDMFRAGLLVHDPETNLLLSPSFQPYYRTIYRAGPVELAELR